MTNSDLISLIVDALSHKKCWYVSRGGAAVNTFQLAFGAKVRRKEVIFLRGEPDEFDRYEGEANLLVWCTWRLDSESTPLTSSDDTQPNVIAGLNRLVGQEVTSVKIDMPGWDLHIGFSGRMSLRVFCDHVPGDPSFDGNWDLFIGQQVISIGVGSKCETSERQMS